MHRIGWCLLAFLLAAWQDRDSTWRPEEHRVIATRLPPMRGDSLRTEILEVTYAPGESSPPHRHPCAVVGYVLQGALRTQVAGDTERVLRAGQAFYEPPMALHRISANASKTDMARFLAIFTCDRGGTRGRTQRAPRKDTGS